MWELHNKTEEHWVPLAIIVGFKRMRKYGDLGVDWVATCLHDSNQLELKTNDAEAKTYQIRRKHPLTEPPDDFDRSIYAVC